ncbi:hypothetical protein PYW07_017047 [Mythimna separata]|uniref:MADF domain-containing protein n=1 Tax=Mythimna separata TaxID=271217 RepID=A0AAD8DY58_MYTSE|nr:hypothetical protein PYW07_017047 [Mythimna separata]
MADKITLNFIEDYRKIPHLWDPNNKLYTKKVKRNNGLQVLATKYNMDIDGVKKKIKSLRSYFSKEHQKVMKKNSGAGSDEIYVSPWFAYKHLLFTADSVTPRETRETSTKEKKDTQAEVFIRESSVTSQSTCMSEDEHDFILPSIRKKRNVENKKTDEEEASKFMKKATEELNQKDEFTLYGQLIAHKIRNLNPLNRLLAQQRINNTLFNLEMQQMTGAAATQNATEIPNVIEIFNDTEMPNDSPAKREA